MPSSTHPHPSHSPHPPISQTLFYWPVISHLADRRGGGGVVSSGGLTGRLASAPSNLHTHTHTHTHTPHTHTHTHTPHPHTHTHTHTHNTHTHAFLFVFVFFSFFLPCYLVSHCRPPHHLPSPHRLVGLVLRRPPRERKIPGSNLACDGIFSGSSHTSDFKIALQWLPCQAPGVIGSALGLVGPVSVYYEWVR